MTLSAQGEGFRLDVRDDGVGLTGTIADAEPGLGSGVIKALAGQLDAVIIGVDAKPGFRVTVSRALPRRLSAQPRGTRDEGSFPPPCQPTRPHGHDVTELPIVLGAIAAARDPRRTFGATT